MKPTREELFRAGYRTVKCIIRKDRVTHSYLRPPGTAVDEIFTTQESQSDYWRTYVEADAARNTAQWLTGHDLAVVERPTLAVPLEDLEDARAYAAARLNCQKGFLKEPEGVELAPPGYCGWVRTAHGNMRLI